MTRPDQPRPRELRGLATALQILLAAFAMASALDVAVLVRSFVLANRVRDDDFVSIGDIDGIARFAHYVGILQFLLFVATAVQWIRWLYRARTNVDAWGGDHQRLATGWAIGGWFVPFGNLVLPAIVTIDVTAGTDDRDEGHPRTRQPLAVTRGVLFALAVVTWTLERIVKPDVAVIIENAEVAFDPVASYLVVSLVAHTLSLVVTAVGAALVSNLTRRRTARIERRVVSAPAG